MANTLVIILAIVIASALAYPAVQEDGSVVDVLPVRLIRSADHHPQHHSDQHSHHNDGDFGKRHQTAESGHQQLHDVHKGDVHTRVIRSANPDPHHRKYGGFGGGPGFGGGYGGGHGGGYGGGFGGGYGGGYGGHQGFHGGNYGGGYPSHGGYGGGHSQSASNANAGSISTPFGSASFASANANSAGGGGFY